MAPRARLALIAGLLALAGCSDPAPSAAPEPDEEGSPVPAPAPRPSPDPTPGDALGEPAPVPAPRTLRIEAQGVTLVGDLRAGDGPDAPLVILVHQLSTDRGEWAPLLGHLAAAPAVSTFTLDMRGHGQSTAGPDGATLDWNGFETADWEAVADDVRAALTHLLDVEGLTPRRVLVVGSSIGSSAVIRAAADDPRVGAVVALSPGRAYRGVDAITPIARLGARPLLAVASREELPAAETATDMARIAERGEVLLVEGDVHGVRMFERDPASLARVVRFLRAQAGAAPNEEGGEP